MLDGNRTDMGAENCCASCSRNACRVSIDDVPRERVIADAEQAFEARELQGTQCDFIMFLPRADGELIAAPIELKSGSVNLSVAVHQLQGRCRLLRALREQGIWIRVPANTDSRAWTSFE